MPLYTGKGEGERVAWMPTVDVMRKGEDLLVRAELPGVKPEDIDVSVTDDVLTVKGTREEEAEYREGEYIRKESSFGTFERQVMLPQGTQTQDITADYHEGVLEVTVPGAARSSRPETQRIPISGVQQRPQTGEGTGQGMQSGTTEAQQSPETQQIHIGREG